MMYLALPSIRVYGDENGLYRASVCAPGATTAYLDFSGTPGFSWAASGLWKGWAR